MDTANFKTPKIELFKRMFTVAGMKGKDLLLNWTPPIIAIENLTIQHC